MREKTAMAGHKSTTPRILHGTGIVDGVLYADAVWHVNASPRPEHPREIAEQCRPAELTRFQNAVANVSHHLDSLAAAAELGAATDAATDTAAGTESREIIAALSAIVQDRGFARIVAKKIDAGCDAEWAVDQAVEQFIERFTQAGGVVAARVTDLADLRSRLLCELRGEVASRLPMPQPAATGSRVLLCTDLAPVDLLTLDLAAYSGVITAGGGPTSHTAIVARQRGIPCVVAVGEDLATVNHGEPLLIDAATGTITIGADPAEARAAANRHLHERTADHQWRGPVRMTDGATVALLANVHDAASARIAAASPAAGVGLFRTEFALLAESTEPATAQQAAQYSEVLQAFLGKRVVFRTIDAGSDKPVKFLHQTQEENPALGVRGVRIARTHPGVIERQLDAIRAACDLANCAPESVQVMAPMAESVGEARWFAAHARVRGFSPGIMVETPAAALMAEFLASELDFLSIGTNDLTQYTMAADREMSTLADLCTPWQPAVLRLIRMVCAAAQRRGVPVGVCGEAAADPHLASVFVGLGASSLSMGSAAIGRVGSLLDTLSYADCVSASAAACAATDAEAARAAVATALNSRHA